MKEKIKENINDPEKLENLYRSNRKAFESDFEKVYPEIADSDLAKFWKIRLDLDKAPETIRRFSRADLITMIGVCLLAGFLIKIPVLFNIDLTSFLFYEKNAGIIFFFGLALYTILVNKDFDRKNLLITILAFTVPAIYINLLPSDRGSSSVNLAYIHLPLLMWCTYGLVFTRFSFRDKGKRIEFIRHNGDLAVLGAIILIAGGVLTGITIGLFQAININIEKFYMDNVVMVGIVSAPIITTFILNNYPAMTSKIVPVIAHIFSPLVLLTLLIYLTAIAISGKDPYNDRDFLLIFNVMLVGVMGIIVFSVSETSINGKQKFNELILFSISIIAVIIDLIALSAIFYRLMEYGLTPNRLAVLGSNILILINLIQIMIDLFKINFKEIPVKKVELTISRYLPVYLIWILIVIFAFPVVFGMK